MELLLKQINNLHQVTLFQNSNTTYIYTDMSYLNIHNQRVTTSNTLVQNQKKCISNLKFDYCYLCSVTLKENINKILNM
jgi:hypothetical protein